MTVETTVRKQNFAGGQAALTFTFKALADHPEDIKVIVSSGGTETILTYSSAYTVSLNSDGVGGTVTVSPSYSSAYTYTVYRETTNKQESDYDDYNQFPADTLEEDLDRRTLVEQEIGEETDRTLKLPISVTGVDAELPAPQADRILGWNAGGDAIENKTPASIEFIQVDTDPTFAADSDSRAPTQKAIKTYLSFIGTPMYFDNAAITTGTMTITTSGSVFSYARSFTVADSNGTLVIPDSVTFLTTGVTLNMTSYLPIASTWSCILI